MVVDLGYYDDNGVLLSSNAVNNLYMRGNDFFGVENMYLVGKANVISDKINLLMLNRGGAGTAYHNQHTFLFNRNVDTSEPELYKLYRDHIFINWYYPADDSDGLNAVLYKKYIPEVDDDQKEAVIEFAPVTEEEKSK